MAVVGEPQTLHPLYATSQVAHTVLAPVFVGCIGQDETGAPVALGCERVPTLENGDARFVGEGDDRYLEVTFRIRPGWRWTDGQPVTAQDAVYAWQLAMAPEAQVRDPLAQKIFAMTASDDRTIVARFMSAAQARAAAAGALQGEVAFDYFSQRGDYARYARQTAPLSDARYWAAARWLPVHLLADVPARDQLNSAFASRPVGDGAFEIVAWNKGAELTLARSAQPFPLAQVGNAPQITFRFAPDEATAAQWVLSGDAQIAQPIPLDSIEAALDAPAFDALLGASLMRPMPVFEQIMLNVNRPPLDDVKVRQALRLAIDTQAILSDPATGLVTAPLVLDPSGLFYGIAPNALAINHDLEQARALLREAGWQCDLLPCVRPAQQGNRLVTQTLHLTLVTNERVPRNALSQMIQKQLAAAGFDVDLYIVSGLGKASKLFAPFEAGGILLTRNFDAALFQAPSLTHFRGALDCASIPDQTNHSPTQGNAGGYCDPTADRLMAEAEEGERVVSEQARMQAIEAALAAVNDAALIVPLYSPMWVVPVREVVGLRYAGFGILTWNAWEWRR
ncbi:MAG: ABC transporter substrate-binding protein [Anaerolineae bacterium]